MRQKDTSKYLKDTSRMILKKISIDRIDLLDKRFVVTFGEDLSRLISSIKMIGCINPPILREDKESFQIISGYKRVSALKRLKKKEVCVYIFYGEDIDAFFLNLYENVCTRKFNEVEKSLVINKLLDFGVKEEEIIERYLPLIDLPSHRKVFDKYRKIVKLDDCIKKSIVNGKTSISIANKLLEFSLRDRSEIFQLVSKLALSSNLQLEFITYLEEIAKREEIPIFKITKGVEIKELLNSKVLTPREKTEKLRTHLRKRRYPLLSQAESNFQNRKMKLGLLPRIHLLPPANFEGEGIRVEFSFKDTFELKKILSNLKEVSESKELASLLNSLSGLDI
ncbi:MAG: ParB N-terminal domain-containing protein [bacterium]|nr:ParB N-terminal domain-containing protein [bacterium]